MSNTMPCPKCAGTGQITLPFHLEDTLHCLREVNLRGGYEPTVGDLRAEMIAAGELTKNCRPTSMNNRLTALFELGLVERTGKGTPHSPYHWRAK